MSKPVYLVGLPAIGKSELGKKLAYYLQFGFLDLDEIINKNNGMTASEYIEKKGWDAFREGERGVLFGIDGIRSHVVALGSGIVESEGVMNFLNETGETVFIDVPLSHIAKRLYMQPDEIRKRPIFSGAVDIEDHDERLKFLENRLKELRQKRISQYESATHHEEFSYTGVDFFAKILSGKIRNKERQQLV